MAQGSGGKIPPGYLDHELVHGWWGNGVFVDYGSGNWCEALTTYCSNYLRKEWESPAEGAKARRAMRFRFAARVRPDRDYPLRKFTGKREDFENDIGYSKGAMLFQMARSAVGDEAFFGGLRDLAKGFTGKRASWDDVRGCIERRAGRNLRALFDATLDRTGAPVAFLRECSAAPAGDGWAVHGTVVQARPAWPLSLPVVVETDAGIETTTVDSADSEAGFSLRTKGVPLRVLLDPDAACWRGYLPGEVPATLDATLHDPAGFEVYTRAGRAGEAYAPVAEALKDRGASFFTVDGEGNPTPIPPASAERSALLLMDLDEGLQVQGILNALPVFARFRGGKLTVGDRTFEGEDVAILASVRKPGEPGRFLTLYGGTRAAALSAARRVFYYGGEGVVVFKAGRPVLRIEAQGEESSRAPLLAAPGLFPPADPDRVKSLVDGLCAGPLLGRLAGTPAGEAAAALVRSTLAADGLDVVAQPVSFEVADWDGSPCIDPAGGEGTAKGIPFWRGASRPSSR